KFGCLQPFNYVAASFVRRAQDVFDIKKLLIENDRPDIQVIAKIENKEGVENIDEILNIADGIMIARGDLGVEVPAEDVPLIQKSIISKCKDMGKIVITATQMLESMQTNPRPTRAEVSDVANAIFDGTDAIMLSGESAAGQYPQESVMTMSRIALKTEQSLDYDALHRQAVLTAGKDTSEAICMSVAEIASKFQVAAIIAFTESGFTARKMSRYRPEARIIAATPIVNTTRSLALSWGVTPVICKTMKTRSSMMDYAEIIAKENGVASGDLILVTGGKPGLIGDTSYLELVRVK
ncbi:MAG TPA: pyruvate kinase, partial [[Clostridium] spiroforme]|nr:pyruvate kinase [Thomasclavelia spiroformis]